MPAHGVHPEAMVQKCRSCTSIHALHLQQLRPHLVDIDVGGRELQQYVQGLTHHADGVVEDDHADDGADYRVGLDQVEEDDEHGGQ